MNVLVIAPHADDEILGVGASMVKWIAEGHRVVVCIVTRGYEPIFKKELIDQVLSEAKSCHEFLNISETILLNFPAAALEMSSRSSLNEKLGDVVQKVKPEIVFIPHPGDMQKDHQMIAESAMVALRPKYQHKVAAIYTYETLSETEWNIPNVSNTFIPNVYNDVSDYIDIKIKAMNYYASQLSDFPSPRSLQAIEALAKYRGSTVQVKAAEAFALVRQIMR
ncbi:MAG: GlcNAc-PI de-N-acetylase [Herbinix sp.]|jgi:LmbE family N-acetylglucosaminyl deacetylase|nr:GlcNAc-PI de-N-acetylase [Herbinix sp.]